MLAQLATCVGGAEIESNDGWTLPKGGFTDVGRHTGITPPNTAYPLVREVLKVSPAQSALLCPLLTILCVCKNRFCGKKSAHGKTTDDLDVSNLEIPRIIGGACRLLSSIPVLPAFHPGAV